MPGDRRVLIAALVVSLLANLFLAGVVTGHFLAPGPLRPQSAATWRPGALRNLPPEERMRFALVMRAHAPALRDGREKLKAARQAVQEAITQPQYDAALVALRFAALRAATQEQQTLQQTALAEALGQLSAQSRATLVAAQAGNARAPGGKP